MFGKMHHAFKHHLFCNITTGQDPQITQHLPLGPSTIKLKNLLTHSESGAPASQGSLSRFAQLVIQPHLNVHSSLIVKIMYLHGPDM